MSWNLRCFGSSVCFFMLLSFFLFSGCAHRGDNVSLRWLTGTTNEKFHDVERHLGGFGAAMWEVGYRYTALYWAGEDENWLYADYQLDEMEEALEHGFERRPARVESAVTFMENALPRMIEAAQAKNSDRFHEAFQNFTVQCNMCHALEEVAFIAIKEPLVRASSVRF